MAGETIVLLADDYAVVMPVDDYLQVLESNEE